MNTVETSNFYAIPLELPVHHGGVYYRKLNAEDNELLLEDWTTVNQHEEEYKRAVETNPKCMHKNAFFLLLTDSNEKWILSEIEKRY